MTPIFGKHRDPDEHPTTGDTVGAIIIAIVIVLGAWFADIIKNFPPQLPQ